MAQDLIQECSGCTAATQPVVQPPQTVAPVADLPRPRSSLWKAIPFRSVNQRWAPGYDPGLQRHHLLPRQLLSKPCFGSFFLNIGREWLGLDDFRSNGMLLPSSEAAALRIGLPLHRGPHRDYNVMVIERIGLIEANWSRLRRRAPKIAHDDAMASLGGLQNSLRRRLLDQGRKRLALNRHDPLGHGTDFAELDAMVDLLWPHSEPRADEQPVRIDQAPGFAAAIPVRAANLAFA
jgi:hypothetical protein